MTLRDSCEALITKSASLSSHDGPGLRTTVFFKGCPLRCKWCHNPETIRHVPELAWDRRHCIGCQTCKTHCGSGAIRFSGKQDYLIEKKRCIQCFACVEHCPAQALRIVGKTYSVDALEALILKDESWIRSLSGGVTFSGGEPALQSEFIAQLAQRLKGRGIHLALDTCGMAPWESYKRVLPYMDLLLFDLKEMDPAKHVECTGLDNQLIHANILRIGEAIHTHRLATRIWIRTPLIPGMTASQENIAAIGTFIHTYLSDYVDKWELCAFNNLCNDKYDRLGMRWDLKQAELISERAMKQLLVTAKQSAACIKHITANGFYKTEQ